MATTIPAPLLDLLYGPILRVRTGLWLVPPQELAGVPDEAVRAGIGTVDLRAALLAALPAAADFVALNAARVLELLDQAASKPAPGRCVATLNLDLLLARLTVAERAEVWAFSYSSFTHRPTALLLVMPNSAHALLPSTSALEQWRQSERLYPQVD